ncbi:uncharacterized protein LOC133823866 [Humulus lupulus]|uniref:uncharacterized protein LOC133823866 n=1 Tax=Humulus lupulus TaxID=3486 RepID=UPI002B40A245|nr:uncharacterized protein LOC133823866 [Humulus lupulus]
MCGWSNKSFDLLLDLLSKAFPKDNKIPRSYYDAKKMLRDLGLGYETIHVCEYDCALFWKENKKAERCPICGHERYKFQGTKGKKIPHKKMQYFPITPRLQRLFMSHHTSSDMRWHKEERVDTEGVLRHPADAEAWKDFDRQYPDFAKESRNVRLGFATDGFNPFGDLLNSYSMWPVLLMPYNMPPWRCMKREFLMMALLIPGRRAPGKDIDVYLQPRIDELKELWENGVPILWTIDDFPAYGTVSGYSTQGYKACPVCEDDTSSFRIRGKTCFMGHRRYLCLNHQWRNDMEYDGTIERRSPPRILTGDEILDKLKGVWKCRAGKNDKIIKDDKQQMKDACYENNMNWRRKSILWDLEYWPKLKLRHNLDVMHIEKNICDSVVGTIFSIDGKSKDTEKARLDLQDLNIRKQLHMKKKGNKWFKPVACYTLSAKERQEFCTFIKSVKFPDGYAANISQNVNMKDGKLFGLKSHDCHILLQRLLPIGLRPYLKKKVMDAIAELSLFFKKLCARKLYVKDLEELEKGVVLTLCKLESIFPPAFFDLMIHLMVHLPLEAKLGGPIKKMNETIFGKSQEDLYAIAMQPSFLACTYAGCMVNGVRYHTKSRDERLLTQNYGVHVEAKYDGNIYEPFVLANQVSLVFYLDDIKKSKDNKDWKVVQKVNHRHIWDIPSKSMDGEVGDEDPTINNIECDNHQLFNELQINHNDQVQSDINSDDTDEEALLDDSEDITLSDEID